MATTSERSSKSQESSDLKLIEANDAKIKGNSVYKAGDYDEALLKYDLAIQSAPDGPMSVENRSICYGNRAACFSNMGKYEESVKECTKALELNPDYLKALLRRGEGREKLKQYDESIAGKLKDMGSSVIGKLGISFDNIKTGAISMSF